MSTGGAYNPLPAIGAVTFLTYLVMATFPMCDAVMTAGAVAGAAAAMVAATVVVQLEAAVGSVTLPWVTVMAASFASTSCQP